MDRRRAALALLPAALVGATAFGPPGGHSLPYDLAGVLASSSDLFAQPVEPGEQYPPTIEGQTVQTVPPPQAEAPAPSRAPKLALTVDASLTGDSNITNATDRREVVVDYGSGPLPVPLDPNLREKSGLGASLSATASLKLPVSERVSVALGAEGYAIEYRGRRGDDASILGAAGVELSSRHGRGTVQLLAFDRWYGGTEAMKGYGVRANWREQVGEGRNVAFYLDARHFDSGYGAAFGGNQASAYLTYDAVLDPTLTAAGGVYLRRDDLRDDSYSSTEAGLYGNLTHYLGSAFTGGIGAGASRAVYDQPVPFLSAEARRDWRGYGTAWITTRKPIGLGLYPSLTYTYSRTESSIGYFDADRHRLRFGLSRSF